MYIIDHKDEEILRSCSTFIQDAIIKHDSRLLTVGNCITVSFGLLALALLINYFNRDDRRTINSLRETLRDKEYKIKRLEEVRTMLSYSDNRAVLYNEIIQLYMKGKTNGDVTKLINDFKRRRLKNSPGKKVKNGR